MTPIAGTQQEGPWDPDSYTGSEEEKIHFFSGHKMRPGNRKDQVNFACWAIEESLRERLPGRFQISGNIMEAGSAASTTGEAFGNLDPDKIIKAIKVEGQRDIDAEDPNASDSKCEVNMQSISAAAQTLVSASPNSLGPPIEPCAKYLRMEKCGEYGRDRLTVWRSPLLFPRINGEEGAKNGFLDQQLTSIIWILQRFLGELPRLRFMDPETDERIPDNKRDKEIRKRLQGPKYSGGILADSMGLGKTLSCIACLELMAAQGLNVIRKGPNGGPIKAKYRPMLILAPNATVASQWIEEICQSTDPDTIHQIITSGNGLQFKKHPSGRVRSLTAQEFAGKWPEDVQHVWKDGEKRAAKTVIIMSIDTFASRTVEIVKDKSGRAECVSRFTKDKRRFSVVIVDEAHKVKNDATRNWKSVVLLDRQFTLLVTATPVINTMTDLMGLARLLWSIPSEYLMRSKHDTWKEIEKKFAKLLDLKRLDDVEVWDDLYLVAGRPGLLAKMLCRNRGANYDIQQVRDYLKYFESLAILRRSPSSSLFSDWEKTKAVSLEGLFPNVEYNTVDIQLDPELEPIYQTIHLSLLTDYVKAINNLQGAKKKPKTIGDAQVKTVTNSVTRCHRLLQVASASVTVYQLDKLLSMNNFGTMVHHITTMRRARVTLPRLVQFMQEQDEPKATTALDCVKIATRRSPILRYILYDVKENLLNRGPEEKIKKLLITEASPILAYYYELVLQFLGLNCRTFHADLSQEARRELVDNFNSDGENSCQILIQMYTVAFAGSNLHRNCSRVLIASQASSLAVQWQAIHRVIRVGQMSDVKVYRLKVKNSYHSFRESRQVEKILPELGARAQGSMIDVLVDILNLFQREIDDAWKSPEALELVAKKSLLLDDDKAPDSDNQQGDKEVIQDNKRQKLDDGSALPTKNDDEAPTETTATPSTPSQSNKRNHDGQSQDKAELGSAGWFRNISNEGEDAEDGFLALKTRNDYYDEYKVLPKSAKRLFSHEKNGLRRLLSYGSPDGNETTRIWTADDLETPAVLERAIELMLRVRLGTGPIHMLPLPQIDLSLAPLKERIALQRQLANVTSTEQDVEAAREQLESPKKGVKETLPGDTSIEAPCSEIEKALDNNSQMGLITAAQMEKANKLVHDPDHEDDVNMQDIPAYAFVEQDEGNGDQDENEVEESDQGENDGRENNHKDGDENNSVKEHAGVQDAPVAKDNGNDDNVASKEAQNEPKVKVEEDSEPAGIASTSSVVVTSKDRPPQEEPWF